MRGRIYEVAYQDSIAIYISRRVEDVGAMKLAQKGSQKKKTKIIVRKGKVVRPESKRIRVRISPDRIYILDANASSFGEQLTRVFKANVKKARQENEKVIGAPDVVPDAG
jgi:hypothetical protein